MCVQNLLQELGCLDELDGLRITWALGNPVDRGGWRSARIEQMESLLPHVGQLVRVR